MYMYTTWAEHEIEAKKIGLNHIQAWIFSVFIS